ncbi:hypothetical protein [Saccharomonospora azurea]|uniref:hypothetical protein n=1 Tax=Saccharomonospora azurea TaxID=40988 RepID=UPI003D8C483E
MSVSDLASAVDRVLALRPTPALQKASGCLDEATNVLGTIATGSAAPELAEAVDGLLRAREELAQVQQTCSALGEVLGRYLGDIGVGRSDTASSTVARPSPTTPHAKPVEASNQALIAELQRQGYKISPERVVRIARLPDERVVWLEEGDDRRGLQHIIKKHGEDFVGCGIPESKVVDLVFNALTEGREIGYTATDRPVYEVRYGPRVQRVAVTVSENGFIVGANPLSPRSKVKTWKKQ